LRRPGARVLPLVSHPCGPEPLICSRRSSLHLVHQACFPLTVVSVKGSGLLSLWVWLMPMVVPGRSVCM